MQPLEDLFQDYTPPNAGDYRTDILISKKLWPRVTLGWSIGYNTELMKNPPKSWMDLTKPEYGPKLIGQVVAPSGGTTWTRVMFERQVLGEDYHKRQAATQPVLYPSGAPLSDALVRGEVSIAPLLYNIVYVKKRDGAPVEIFFPPEGLSQEGQAFMIKEQGNLTALKEPPAYPPGWDPKVVKTWAPDFQQYVALQKDWIEEWNKTYGYRQ
jgi:iron(III) transport system substrate-binding protein